jgi:nitrite reductase (NADH) small subunit
MTAWIDLCALDDIPVLGARRVRRADGPEIAVFRADDDRVFALLDHCPHKGGPLSQGIVFGDRVACPLHNWTIELATGQAVAPDRGCVRRFAVRVEGGRVLLGAQSAPASREAAEPADIVRPRPHG